MQMHWIEQENCNDQRNIEVDACWCHKACDSLWQLVIACERNMRVNSVRHESGHKRYMICTYETDRWMRQKSCAKVSDYEMKFALLDDVTWFCGWAVLSWWFPTCQVRVVRFYVNSRSFSSFSSSSSPDLNYDDHSRVFAAGPQPRPSTPSVRCRTSTTTSHAQCSLPDLNHDHPRPVFAAGPQPRPSTPSVRCRTSTTTIHAQCSLPDLNSNAKSYAR